MLEEPALADEKIIACLRDDFAIPVTRIDFLPLGADNNTAVCRVAAADDSDYFAKLRRGAFDETAVSLTKYLSEQGIRQIIAPLPTRAGKLWASVENFRLILYPFTAGHDGYETSLSDENWIGLGAALKQIHTLEIPVDLTSRIRHESFSSRWRDAVLSFMKRIEYEEYTEPVAAELAVFLRTKGAEIQEVVGRAGRLAEALRKKSLDLVLCHADLHAGNLLINASGNLFIVDWDEPVFAPRERDLMCAGSGLMGGWRTPEEEENLLYLGYGPVQVDQTALAYYRYERIIMDIAAFCEQLLLSEEGGANRQQALRWLKSNFEPDGTIAIVCRADRSDIHC